MLRNVFVSNYAAGVLPFQTSKKKLFSKRMCCYTISPFNEMLHPPFKPSLRAIAPNSFAGLKGRANKGLLQEVGTSTKSRNESCCKHESAIQALIP
ncbi:hypothetical protein CDAR_14391 [Caerostris darwini]|uniref:Uncharacterized protein n=1 Tax=Caerostris darwini TaxID=1538125 RepID=A0AAV4QFZ1_9ARAC|nr:hypothetical protein CDAR_14391 [Caerostris darwini]